MKFIVANVLMFRLLVSVVMFIYFLYFVGVVTPMFVSSPLYFDSSLYISILPCPTGSIVYYTNIT